MDGDSHKQKGEVGDFDFNTVFKQPHGTPDRDEIVDRKKEIARRRKEILRKQLPKISSHEEFLSMLKTSDLRDEKRPDTKGGKRKTRRYKKSKKTKKYKKSKKSKRSKKSKSRRH